MTGLACRGLSFGYEPAQPVVEDLTLGVERGEMLAIRGASGSGKSTLLYLLGLMLRPRAGEVLVGGERVDHLPDAARARLRAHHLGFVFQDAALDPTRSVLDNVTETALYRWQSPDAARGRARELLEHLGVAARAHGRPGQISGGQAQRIALARALLGAPAVILADEPTGNLDATSAGVVIEALRAFATEGGAVVIVTHGSDVAHACDRVVTLGAA